ncbi:ankyrin repeat domain protein [Wolbachia endosymbiont of Armadillidium vulgare str. wVulC]|uniref:ankyrin repeat domain-containing protein n=1 Tax=Wolbachia endosymbiont of Armadillidium vulgare TaxID=77039 RepID=UPI0002175FB7|nr:ankyrin repeat domain-containing protein [Wolbachia endosymbiont of Armadillidium vulgare]AEH76049.1 ankyrin repeat-containing protein Pk2 [Wolbachia phage WO]KLT21836.1 ankyrin repeat domain protein [Wolbachia endosymbiont of Armadillidium vulgare str. wVulC]KLT22389.1 ankyrin repeat domain protein [Wolbachia endosymbiont of Armadillidium vulgare str. wVulC]
MLKLGKFNKSAKELLENSYENIYERDEKGRTVLHYAVDAKTVRLLVEKGANVNAADVEGHTALHLAVTEKRLETVRELIKSGGNVNAEEYGNKCTPLHLACMVGEKEIVEELVKAGGEIEQADKFGMTAMDYAKNSKEIAEVLKKETDRIEKLFEQQSGKSSMRG